MMQPVPNDDLTHVGCSVEEWVFAAWAADGSMGFVSGHRLWPDRRRAWYWFAVAQRGQPVLHLAEWDVSVRPDPFIVKAPEMWAEHHCDEPMRQWSIGNEAHAVALDDPVEVLGRGYGDVTPIATDVEWYATAGPVEIENGYQQTGVAHGLIELIDRPNIEFSEIPGRRWHRWKDTTDLDPIPVENRPDTGDLRVAFLFPDDAVSDWQLGRDGWFSASNHP